MRDVKELIGIIMRVLDGAEVTQNEILDLDFDAEGELLVALNEAFTELMQFAQDHELRQKDAALDQRQRAALQGILNKIVALWDAQRV